MASTQREKLNKIVRQDMAVGNAVLNALEKWDKITKRHHPSTEAGSLAALARADFSQLADILRDEAVIIRQIRKASD